jgi:hypothetical protein
MKTLILCLILALPVVACRQNTEEADDTETAPPAASVAPIAGAPLDTALALVDKELRLAIDNKLDNTGFQHFQRAEALSDRLLETRYPFQWLKGESYALEAKLRQIQALADRVAAELRSGTPPDSAMYDLRLAQTEVTSLRSALKAGGGTAPLSLDKLMEGQDTMATTASLASEGGGDGH